MREIDINCDLGELEDQSDLEVMPFISSCNIACGAHAGNLELMQLAIEKALEYGVSIGAHPGYTDKPNFGRISMPLSAKEIEELIHDQLMLLGEQVAKKQADIKYIKLHGALYHDASSSEEIAKSVVDGVKKTKLKLAFLGPFGSKLQHVALAEGYTYFFESFIDRRYKPNGKLVPRTESGAVLEDPVEIEEQLKDLVMNNRVKTINGKYIELRSDSICIHGDHPGAAKNARRIKNMLVQENVRMRSFINEK